MAEYDDPTLDESTKDIHIDRTFYSYRPIDDVDWERRMFGLTNNTPLSDGFFDFQVALVSSINSFAMPWITVAQMVTFADGFTKKRLTFAEDYVNRITSSLTKRVHFTKNKKDQVEDVLQIMKSNSLNELSRYNKENPFDDKAYWEDLIGRFPFRVAVWGLQRLCFSGMYFAYEDYLKQLCRVVSNDHNLWFGRADIAADLIATHLGEHVKLECWTDDHIDTCRLIRNSLAHSGGIETPDLAKKQHGLVLEEVKRVGKPTRKEIQIMPSNIRELFGYITAKSEIATKAAIAKLSPP